MRERDLLCTFEIDNLLFGVDVRQVQEVIRHLEMTRVPLASSFVRGLINLRGQLVTAIDLRRKLNLKDYPTDSPPMNVVILTHDGPFSLLVDEIGDVIEVDSEAFEPAPETLQGTARELIRGAYKLKDRLLLSLDTDKAIQCGEDAALPTPRPSTR